MKREIRWSGRQRDRRRKGGKASDRPTTEKVTKLEGRESREAGKKCVTEKTGTITGRE